MRSKSDDPPTIQGKYAVHLSEDGKMVAFQFSAPITRVLFDPKEARRLSGMLRRVAAACKVEKKSPPPPIRDTRYMEVEECPTTKSS